MIEMSTIHIIHSGSTLGTGFLVGKDLAITCAHVITAVGENIQVQFAGQVEIISARVISECYRDPNNGDIAFLRLEKVPENITPLRLGAAEHSPSGSPFQAFGYPIVGAVEGVHARGELLGIVAENGHRLLQLRSEELNQGYSGAPVWDEKRSVVVGMVVSVYKSDASGKLRDTAFAVLSETLWQLCPEIRPSETPPYIGLGTFTDKTAQFFFGRDALTEKLLNALRGGNRFLAVFGPSGSGKSSVVRAGLLPALKKGQLPGSQKWVQITMRPVDNPFEQIKAAGLDPFDIDGYLKARANAERIVLFIDQFEELFTLCPDNVVDRFAGGLATALENPKLILVLSMRDDFYSAFNAKASKLAISNHLSIENVPGNLKRDELIAMIERPAEAIGLALEEGLTELIMKDATIGGETRSSMLPLLEFALTQLWEKRRDGLLLHDAYQSIGGVTGSLARWADDAYSNLPNTDEALAESALISLVHLGDEAQGLPDTRRRRTLAEFDDSTRRVIKYFTDRRLIITSGENVELVHDALVREWGRLQTWLKNDHDNLRLREGLGYAADQWEAGGRDDGLLNHRDALLELTLSMSKLRRVHLSPIEQAYLNACVKLLKNQKTLVVRRRKYIVAGISVVLVVIIGILVAWGMSSTKSANEKAAQVVIAQTAQADAEEQARIAQSRELSNQALQAAKYDEELGLLLAIRSVTLTYNINKTYTPDGLGSLYQLMLTNKLIKKLKWQGNIISIDCDPTASKILAVNEDGSAILWDREGNVLSKFTEHTGKVNEAKFNSLGTMIVTASSDGTASLWDSDGNFLTTLQSNSTSVVSAQFSKDGKMVVTASKDYSVHIWDINGSLLSVFTNLYAIDSISFSPDDTQILTADQGNTAELWDVDGTFIKTLDAYRGTSIFSPSGRYIFTSECPWNKNCTGHIWDKKGDLIVSFEIASMTEARSVAFSPDETMLIIGGCNNSTSACEVGVAQLWKTEGTLLTSLDLNSYWINTVDFSSDGTKILTGGCSKLGSSTSSFCQKGSLQVWDISGKLVSSLDGHSNWVNSARFSNSGSYIVSGSADETVRLWDWNGSEISSWKAHVGKINSANFSRDGELIVTTGQDQSVAVWDKSGKLITRLSNLPMIESASFSPDGTLLLVSGEDVSNIYTTFDKKFNLLKTITGSLGVFNPDGTIILTANPTGAIRLWDIRGNVLRNFQAHQVRVISAGFSWDGKRIITTGCNRTYYAENCEGNARVWDLAGNLVSELNAGPWEILPPTSATMVKQDSNILVDSWLWDKNGKLIGKWSLLDPQGHETYDAKFNSFGSQIAASGRDGTVWIFDSSGQPIASLNGHLGYNYFAEFSPTDKFIATADDENPLRLWSAEGNLLTELPNSIGKIISMNFSYSGTRLLAASDSGNITIWSVYPDIESLLSAANLIVGRTFSSSECLQYLHEEPCR